MADSCKTTTSSDATPNDSVAQQMDSTRMTAANVRHHNQQQAQERQRHEQEQEQSSGIVACTKPTTTITKETTTAPRTLHSLLGLPTGMELSQIELIYRAEGNANLVLALPQFKKVLRLPKSTVAGVPVAACTISTTRDDKPSALPASSAFPLPSSSSALLPSVVESSDCNLILPQVQSEKQLEKQKPHKQAEKASVTIERESHSKDTTNNLTMKDFASYMQIFRQLVGIAYVLEPDICWIHQEVDRKWLNKHISIARPAHRLDKEFCGQFGLLLPDATQLPSIQADILHSNLQPKAKVNDNTYTYAIEIKPKQGWQLFPNPDASSSQSSSTSHLDIQDLFGIRPIISAATSPPSANSPTSSTPTAAKVARTITERGKTTTTAETAAAARRTVVRCRYCTMQFLKLKNHKISNMNTYCPIELFSGIPSRMLIALDALFRCPQNNLRVFKNGILIYGDHASSISYKELREEHFSGDTFGIVKNLLVECLLREYNAYPEVGESIEISKSLSGVGGVFGQPHSSVTTGKVGSKQLTTTTATASASATTLKIIQTEPDAETTTKATTTTPYERQAVDVKTSSTSTTTTEKEKSRILPSETPEKIRTKTLGHSQVPCSDVETPCLPKNCILQKILHFQLLIKHNLSSMHSKGYENRKEKSYNSLRSLLALKESLDVDNLRSDEQYLLGATALDCSIMVTFRETTEAKNTSILDPKRFFQTRVTMLDLDPKPDSHFSKYIQQTKEAYDEAAKSLFEI